MFHEPDATPYDLRFRIGSVPVRIHPMFWLVTLLMGLGPADEGPARMLIWVGAALVSILVHEMGHAAAAQACGRPAQVTLFALGGLATFDGRGLTRGQRIAIALAGPGAGFLFAAVIVAILYALGASVAAQGELLIPRGLPVDNDNLFLLVVFLLYINVWWGLVNLLPILPLDGGRVSQELLANTRGNGLLLAYRISMVVAGAMAIWGAMRQQWYIAFLFGYLAMQSFQVSQAISDRYDDWRSSEL